MRLLRKFSPLLLVLSFVKIGFSQNENIGIGTRNPDPSSVLDISSSNKGVLLPRLNKSQINNISKPAKGLIVYQLDENEGLYLFDGAKWSPISSNEQKSVANDPNDWTISGNSNAIATSFLGTLNTNDLNFKVNNVQHGKLSWNGSRIFLGYLAGTNALGTGSIAIGAQTLGSLDVSPSSTGNFNTAIGYNSMSKNKTGGSNVGLGAYTLKSNISGGNNLAIGTNSQNDRTGGDFNIGIGSQTLYYNTSGSNNVAIGSNSGLNNISGSGNIFVGFDAGRNETGSNKLYFANSNTANPLIKGEFDNKNLKVNTGSTTSTTVGFLAVGNFDAAFAMPTGNSYRLIVQDGIITEKVKVALRTTADWADYVFEPEYQKSMMSLEQVEKFAKENKHLPNVPSAQQLKDNGMDVGETSKMFMEKIEELTLYMIELNKEVKALKAENEKLKSQLK